MVGGLQGNLHTRHRGAGGLTQVSLTRVGGPVSPIRAGIVGFSIPPKPTLSESSFT